jgi:hypothetical protein
MQFVEGNVVTDSVPQWADFLTRFGYNWIQPDQRGRRICLISLPCDSAGAGFVLVGALRRRLEDENASDRAWHLQRIMAYAHGEKSGVPLKHCKRKGRFHVGPRRPDGVWLWEDRKKELFQVFPYNAYDWQFEDEPFVEVHEGAQIPYKQLYERLIDIGQPIVDANLRQSDSFLCLAGRASGEASTESMMAQVTLTDGNCTASLSGLLSIYAWSNSLVSRCTFFNARTGDMDRNARTPKLVVADGHKSLLRVLAHPDMSESDVIGIYHRAIDRTELEEIGDKIAGLRQWYQEIPQTESNAAKLPRGINILVLDKR